MSKLEVDAIEPQSGTTLTLGASGDTVNIASGATLTGRGAVLVWQSVQTTGFTASAGNAYPCNTTSAAFTVTLPATPSAGDQVQLVDYAGTFDSNALLIDGNGENIEGSAINYQLDGEREGAILTYIDSTQGWIATSGINEGTDALEPVTYSIDFLVVAGGGGGGGRTGGGGGAGGFRTSTQTVTSGTAITVTVGDGGAGGDNGGAAPTGVSGSSSSISGSGLSTITSAGGGGGGGGRFTPSYVTTVPTAGGSGGAGGGALRAGAAGNTPSTSPSQGNNGGTAGGNYTGGGGGGAGAVGANGPAGGGNGGAGGNGTASSITGSSVPYAGGGGGVSTTDFSAPGGTGGGGNGGGTGGSSNSHTAGTVNTGGGGGGPRDQAGKAGGKGVVILSVPTLYYTGTTTGSPTVTTSGANTIMQFNGSGSYTA